MSSWSSGQLAGHSDAPPSPLPPSPFWWQFHQGATAAVYLLMLIPAWAARGGPAEVGARATFWALLAAVVVATTLRLHLWFTSRFYPVELKRLRQRARLPVRGSDWLFVLALAAAGLQVGDDRAALAVLLTSIAVGAAVAFLVIEPVTTRAAFRKSGGP